MCGSARALPCGVAGFGAVGYMAAPEPCSIRRWGSGAMGRLVAPEPTSAGRWSPELMNTWQLVVACSAACVVFILVYEGTDSGG
jgi:hypothetical protein